MQKRYTAGELARWAGVSARTIRFYEEKGILRPRERSAEGYRLYDDSAVLRLQEFLRGIYRERCGELAAGVKLTFLCEDAERWQCPAAGYDMILAGHLWNYIRDKESLLGRLHLGLAKGGRLISTFTSQASVRDVNRILEPVLGGRALGAYEERRQVIAEQMEELFDAEFAHVSRMTFHNCLRIPQPEELLRYLCGLDGELETRIRAKEQEVRKHLWELTLGGQIPEIGTEGHCYSCR